MAQLRTLFENNHFRVQRFVGEQIVLVVRSAVPFASPADAMSACVPMLLVLDRLGRRDFRLLFDSRAAVGNNSPEYEASFSRFRKDLVDGFLQAAFIVKSLAGSLQTRRLLAADGATARSGIFSDPAVGLAFLRAGARRAERPRSTPPAQSPSSRPLPLPLAT